MSQDSPIHFSESFSLVDKSGVKHVFMFSGAIEQKPEIMKTCAQSISKALKNGWTVAAQTPAPATPADPNTTTETIMATQLVVSQDKSGKHFAIEGGRYKKYGLPVYPEYMEALGISEDTAPGAYPFKKKVVVQTTVNSDGKKSSKVVALG